jgi:XTP/dITP diphosphohydrolase
VKVVLATNNPDKARDIIEILDGLGVELVPRPGDVPEVEETGDTLVENARLKAVALVDATSMAAVADDTGLEVDALDGRPGVYSSRFAGEDATYADNVAKLLRELEGVPLDARTARFRTVALLRHPDGTEVVAHGVVEGLISASARGTNGFGYDPLFIPAEGDGRTFAEMASTEKHALSHRGRAFRALAAALR